MISQEKEILFDRYRLDEMSTEEKESFEQSLKENSLLQSEYEEYIQMVTGLERAFLKYELNKIHEETKSRHRPTYRLMPMVLSMTAIIIALVGFFFLTKDNTSVNVLYTADPGLPVVMGKDDTTYDFSQGMVSYKEGNYARASAIWTPLLSANPTNDTLLYYTGLTALELKNYDKAQQNLSLDAVLQSPTFQNKAHYYLGWVYYYKKDIPLSKNHFSLANHYLNSDEIIENLE